MRYLLIALLGLNNNILFILNFSQFIARGFLRNTGGFYPAGIALTEKSFTQNQFNPN
ncbi:hypothetical protein MuYL_3296 [Mucilaginibacter xinganensis]|uniref:Uncharacterized protein n=1 Tax=Mucilaginibacter xinganensis TaxID=1234841 RepID=A0A223P026_9SPHI|nr:hypothetical protein MuYL_3296 [Mucilaginibacter xinganensis]